MEIELYFEHLLELSFENPLVFLYYYLGTVLTWNKNKFMNTQSLGMNNYLFIEKLKLLIPELPNSIDQIL